MIRWLLGFCLLATTAQAAPVLEFAVIGFPVSFSLDYGSGLEVWRVPFAGEVFDLRSSFDPSQIAYGELPATLSASLSLGIPTTRPAITDYWVGIDLPGSWLILGQRVEYAPDAALTDFWRLPISGVHAVPEPAGLALLALLALVRRRREVPMRHTAPGSENVPNAIGAGRGAQGFASGGGPL